MHFVDNKFVFKTFSYFNFFWWWQVSIYILVRKQIGNRNLSTAYAEPFSYYNIRNKDSIH